MRGPGTGVSLCALLAFGWLCPGTAEAQERQLQPVGFWGSLALGPAAPYGFGGAVGAAVRYQNVVLRVRAAASEQAVAAAEPRDRVQAAVSENEIGAGRT